MFTGCASGSATASRSTTPRCDLADFPPRFCRRRRGRRAKRRRRCGPRRHEHDLERRRLGRQSLPSSGTVGEGYDVTDPVPPGVQQDLVRAVLAAGKPFVVVLLNGRPYSVPWMKEHVPAILGVSTPAKNRATRSPTFCSAWSTRPAVCRFRWPEGTATFRPFTTGCLFQHGIYHKPGSPQNPGAVVFSLSRSAVELRLRAEPTRRSTILICESTRRRYRPTGQLALERHGEHTGQRGGRKWSRHTITTQCSSTVTPCKRLIRFQKVSLKPGERRHVAFSIPVAESGGVEHGDEASGGARHDRNHGRPRHRGYPATSEV